MTCAIAVAAKGRVVLFGRPGPFAPETFCLLREGETIVFARCDLPIFDQTITEIVRERVIKLEMHFEADVVFFYGNLETGIVRPFRDFIEKLAMPGHKQRLVFFVNTPGGAAEAVEKMVEIIRFHYTEVYFVIPDAAMSAGTILCMSGNKIYMDYSSSLGPIDPQVFNGTHWVPALGYLDKVDELLRKAQAGTLTKAEFVILQNQDLAMLRRYEQSRDLTVTLLKKWLVEYKFQDWTVHQTNPSLKGQPVTRDQKEARAEEIAKKLGDTSIWHSHGRMISPKTLQDILRLNIDNYSTDAVLRPLIRGYNDLLTEYILRHQMSVFLHNRDHF